MQYAGENVVLGIGLHHNQVCSHSVAVIEDFFGCHGVSSIRALATIERLKGDATIIALAHALKAVCLFYSAEELEQETPKLLNPSFALFNRLGCHSVAEAAALRAAGALGQLICGRTVRGPFTLALAQGPKL